ncbi:MAG: ATP-binding cassette domain-containing protein [Phaeodactylibacter sp.]|nr:ATP-binding cassette domain-containing protein [Phaeodactylibacter sp.]MCB9275047.1 ATP-binding cassette domain-containing protein [Lewinellaceae bacterium]
MLRTSGLQFSYDGHTRLSFPDIDCKSGEHWLLLGHSGSGKTTLLHLLGGLLRPRSGTIEVANTDMSALSPARLDRFRGRNIGIVFQTAHFVRALTVEENLKLAQQLAGLEPDSSRIEELLEHLNLGHKLHAKPERLSIGEQQRAAIARAIVNRPDIILADEPTSALDEQNCYRVIQLLESQARAVGATLLVVTHDQRLKERFPNQIALS